MRKSPPRPPRAPRALAAATSLLFTGCTVLTSPAVQILHPYRTVRQLPRHITGTYNDYVGVIHVHTTYSHDAHGKFEDVVRVANDQRLDYVILTDHNTLQPLRDGLEGRHGAVLVLIGMEISARDGHYLAMNITQEINREHLTTQQIIDEVNRQGGFGFIAHPYFKQKPWTNWSVTGYTGIEGYNVAHDTLDESRLHLVLWTLMAPNEPFYESILDRPSDPLAKWDELLRDEGRRVVGIGSVDAHEFHVLGIKFAPYEDLFRLTRTHLLVPVEKSAQGAGSPPTPLTKKAAYEALKQGHAYFSIELMAEAREFRFTAEDDTGLLGIMGDEIQLVPNLRLKISLPAVAEVKLFRNGQVVFSTFGQAKEFPVVKSGVYRVEAFRHNKPWIFSNPIYIRKPPEPAHEPAAQAPVEPAAQSLPADAAVPAPGSQPSPEIAPR